MPQVHSARISVFFVVIFVFRFLCLRVGACGRAGERSCMRMYVYIYVYVCVCV